MQVQTLKTQKRENQPGLSAGDDSAETAGSDSYLPGGKGQPNRAALFEYCRLVGAAGQSPAGPVALLPLTCLPRAA